MPPPPPALPDDILEQIFLRLPPAEPECLVRASLASKLWLGRLTSRRFGGLYRDRHGAPPMLGFIYSCSAPDSSPELQGKFPIFVATTKFCVRVDDCSGWHSDYAAWDCRHGRILFCNNNIVPMQLMVWDPMTGRRTLQYAPEEYDSKGAAVLCNLAACDYRACHAGAFQLVFVGLNSTAGGASVAYAHVSLPGVGVGMWSEPCPALDLAMQNAFIVNKPPVLIHDALYFMLVYDFHDDDDHDNMAILKYDLRSSCLSLIDAPPVEIGRAVPTILIAMEDGSLEFAYVDGFTLNLWSRQMGSNGVAAWTRRRLILRTLVTIQNPKEKLRLIGSVEYNDIIFVTIEPDIYQINLKSLQVKKIWKREKCHVLFPCMSFYNPPERIGVADAVQLKQMFESDEE